MIPKLSYAIDAGLWQYIDQLHQWYDITKSGQVGRDWVAYRC